MSSGQGQGRGGGGGGGGLSARQVPRLLFAAVLLLQQARDGSCAIREPRKKGLIGKVRLLNHTVHVPAHPKFIVFGDHRTEKMTLLCSISDEKVAAGADEPADPTALTYTHLRYHRIPNRCNWVIMHFAAGHAISHGSTT